MLRVYSRNFTFNVAVSFLNFMSLSCHRVLRWQSDSCDRQHSRRARCAMCTRWSIGCFNACCTRTTQSRASVHVCRICTVCDPPRTCTDGVDWFVEWKEFEYCFLIHYSHWHFWGMNTSEHYFPMCSWGKLSCFQGKYHAIFTPYQIQFLFFHKREIPF